MLPWEQVNTSSVISLIKPLALITWTLIHSVLHLQIYNEKKSQFEIKRNNPKDLVERVARDISKLLNSKRKALEVRQWCCIYYNTFEQTCTIRFVCTCLVFYSMTAYLKLYEHITFQYKNNTLVIISYASFSGSALIYYTSFSSVSQINIFKKINLDRCLHILQQTFVCFVWGSK